jgi:hypothetical protein
MFIIELLEYGVNNNEYLVKTSIKYIYNIHYTNP